MDNAKPIKYAKLHTELFTAELGHTGTTLSTEAGPVYKAFQMEIDGQFLKVTGNNKGRQASVYTPLTNVVLVVFA